MAVGNVWYTYKRDAAGGTQEKINSSGRGFGVVVTLRLRKSAKGMKKTAKLASLRQVAVFFITQIPEA